MKTKTKFFLILVGIVIIGFVLPERFVMPVENATSKNYHPKSFWYYPWGKSGTHKGVDIFAKEGTSVFSSTHGLVIYKGNLQMGGKVVLVLGPKWRVHYFAHLQRIETGLFSFVKPGKKIGSVGTTGNAKGKPAHLHYSIATLIPYPWRIDKSPQGWKKMFYLNPIEYLQ